jgi:lipopolysaccharide/colanic/teichoic acid biosynthesis glycosyltransferase
MNDIQTSTLNPLNRMFTGSPANRAQWRALGGALLVTDTFCVMFALMAAYKLRIDGWLFGWAYNNSTDISAYSLVVLASIPIWIAWASVLGLYRRDNLLGGMIEYKQTAKTCLAAVFTLIVATFWLRNDSFELSRGWIALALLLSVTTMMLARFLMRRVAYALRTRLGWLTARVLIVGANDQGVAIARQWMQSPRSGMRVVGFLDDFKAPGMRVVDEVKVVGRPTALRAAVREHRADEVIVVSSAVAWETFGELMTERREQDDVIMRLSPGFYHLLTSGMAVTNKTFVPLLTMHESRIVGIDAAIKTLFDYTVAAVAFVLTLPAALWVALRLRIAFPGRSVFTSDAVQGQRGMIFQRKRFNVGEANEWPQHGLTRWLMRSGFDRWPQLLHVFAGRMSLVGPRAMRADDMTAGPAETRNLHSVKPGVLGPWVARDSASSPSLLEDDVSYVRNWEIWRDIPIVLRAFVRHVGRVTR